MAFPYIYQANFEEGTLATAGVDWDSTTGSLISAAHYSTLAAIPGAPAPYRGAYCMMVNLSSGTTADQTVTEGDIDIADAGTGYFRWYMFVHKDFTATADDVFNIFELQQAGGTIEMSVSMQITAATNVLEIGFGDGTAQSSFVAWPTRGKWVCVELLATVSTGGAGVATLFLDGTQVQTATSLTQAAAVGQGVLGTQNTLSTTTGMLFFDQFVMDDARVYPISVRFPHEVMLTKSGHVFVGQGTVENVSLMSGAGTDCVLSLVDTDIGNTNDANNVRVELKNTANNELVDPAGVPAHFQRGCYVSLSGTTPRAIVKIADAQGYWGDGRIKQHGAQRKQAPGNW
jgi:hypothetical protein